MVAQAVQHGQGVRAVANEGAHSWRSHLQGPRDAHPVHKALEALAPVERTLLIPLLARVWGHRWHLDMAAPDASAERVLEHLQGRVPTWVSTWVPDPVTLACIVWRIRQLIAGAHHHFEQHPRASGVNLGAGLSDYFQWVDNGVNSWIDADVERVMQLRERCMPPQTRVKRLSMDISEDGWWSRLASCLPARREPMFIMLEGVLLYLQPTQVRQVLSTLAEHAPAGSRLMFDVIARWLVGWPVSLPMPASLRMPVIMPGLSPCLMTSMPTEQPVFQWGIDSLQELDTLHPRLHLESATSVPWMTPGWSWLVHDWQTVSPYAVVQMSVS
jgi:O-methyltransferase involved in polyketide biosynthesis